MIIMKLFHYLVSETRRRQQNKKPRKMETATRKNKYGNLLNRLCSPAIEKAATTKIAANHTGSLNGSINPSLDRHGPKLRNNIVHFGSLWLLQAYLSGPTTSIMTDQTCGQLQTENVGRLPRTIYVGNRENTIFWYIKKRHQHGEDLRRIKNN